MNEAPGDTIYFEDIEIGETVPGATVTVDPDEMVTYGKPFDPWPMHVDEEAARALFLESTFLVATRPEAGSP